MKKSDLQSELEKKFDYIPKREVERTLEKILQLFSSTLAKGNRIELRDFGTFIVKHRKARIGRNPATGEKIKINQKYFVHFKPGKKLKEVINEK
ncbi:MAG: integration host factor subunit beta [Rickettsiales bacterium]|nr:integration host factor subunit beta [Rickettsiales bacterium]RPG14852.1 MAG: integration host factor subunit beta [Pelagibacteraceae bacterium TMED195]|tara:strand:+ start:885 stop:1166 length:282 start_codon:yes stop_codon:yes gene_type:complete